MFVLHFHKEYKYKRTKAEVTINAVGGFYSFLNVLGTTYCDIHKETTISFQRKGIFLVELIYVWLFAGHPIQVINTLSELGYKVICSTGDSHITWTLQRKVCNNKNFTVYYPD
jgi:hypothetical protein